MPTHVGPTPFTAQVAGRDPAGRFILSVLAKRTYTLTPAGRCDLAETQTPLIADPEFAGPAGRLLLHDRDLYPFKPLTDIVINAHAYPTLNPAAGEVVVRIRDVEKRIAVIGDRTAALSASGAVLFSAPAPFEKLPLTFDRAYGGRDAVAEARAGNLYAPLAMGAGLTPAMLEEMSPFTYRRNSAGRGFLITPTPEALAALLLPNFEYPDQPLTPATLAAGHEDRWAFMPMPAGVTWFSPAWYPRVSWYGISPLAPQSPAHVPEESRGWAPAGSLDPDGFDEPNLRMVCGAAPGLSVPLLEGGEEIELAGVWPGRGACTIRLPAHPPTLKTDGRKGAFENARAFLHTVLIEPDLARVTLVWRGAAVALRQYAADELTKMPYVVEWHDGPDAEPEAPPAARLMPQQSPA
ncbi:DUF2169 domain-containing protein [soil metagenome]